MENQTDYGENVAAISAIIHRNPEAYQTAYDKIADDIGGFVGIRNICAEAAKVFTEEEAPYTAGEDFYRIEAIEEFAHQLLWCLQNDEVPESERLHRRAAGAIEKCLIANE